jgi:hypothetical protein
MSRYTKKRRSNLNKYIAFVKFPDGVEIKWLTVYAFTAEQATEIAMDPKAGATTPQGSTLRIVQDESPIPACRYSSWRA